MARPNRSALKLAHTEDIVYTPDELISGGVHASLLAHVANTNKPQEGTDHNVTFLPCRDQVVKRDQTIALWRTTLGADDAPQMVNTSALPFILGEEAHGRLAKGPTPSSRKCNLENNLGD